MSKEVACPHEISPHSGESHFDNVDADGKVGNLWCHADLPAHDLAEIKLPDPRFDLAEITFDFAHPII